MLAVCTGNTQTDVTCCMCDVHTCSVIQCIAFLLVVTAAMKGYC